MKIYNEKYLFGHKGFINESFMDYYQYVGGIMGSEGNAGKCNGCGKCLRKCPQKLDIISELKKVKKEFEFPGLKFVMFFVRHIGFPVYRQVVKLLNR
jgi:predicted aldo/keto reductase-like oxidoreductase